MISDQEIDSLDQARHELGRLLGLSEPVSASAMKAALSDELYAHYLFVCRDAPPFLTHLLNNPPEVVEIEATESSKVTEISTAALLAKAVQAIWKWGQSGFAIADDVIYTRRMEACRVCPNLVEPPPKLVYHLFSSSVSDEHKICSECGCVASRKARLISESCPDRSPQNPAFTRWGELMPVLG